MRGFAAMVLMGCVGLTASGQSARFGQPTPVGSAMPGMVVIPPPPSPLPPPTPGELPPPPPPGFHVGTPVPPGPVATPPVGPPQYYPLPKIIATEQPQPASTRIWGSFEYLMWYSKGDETPPLVAALRGGQLTTLSDDKMNNGLQSGFRATLGIWLDLDRTYGIEASYLWFVRDKTYEPYNDSPDHVLVQPFLNALTGTQSFLQLSNTAGTLRGFARTYNIWDVDGWEVNGLFRAPAMLSEEFHLMLGFRSWSLKEQLGAEGVSYTPANETGVAHFDEIRTRNRFYGLQLGARWHYAGERWTVDLTGKFAVGGVGQETTLRGQTMRTTATGSTLVDGGLLNLSSNSGDFDRTKLAFMPEVSLNFGYRITSFASLFVGYDFLYINNVLRPGRQIDQVVNPTLIPFNGGPVNPTQRPMYPANGEGYWLQGINFGVAFRF